MKALVLGGGKMGAAIAYDLVRSGAEVQVGDITEHAHLSHLLEGAEFLKLNANNPHEVEQAMRNKDIVISALPYDFNYEMAKMAIKCNAGFCDLGGNTEVVRKELSLYEDARKAEVTVIPDCGLAPGMTNVIASHLIKKANAREMHIRVGGLPQNPEPPLNYALVFSVHGLVNEYVEEAKIIRKGALEEVESLTGLEEISFPGFGELEAFYTSGGTSTLPETFYGIVEELDYKTIRYKGHCEKIKFLKDMGFFDSRHRQFTEQILEKALSRYKDDVVLARWIASGEINIIADMVDYCSEGISAMMRTTGFPTSIIAQMIANSTIDEKGALPPERCVPPEKFIEEMKKRNIIIKEKKI